MACAFRCHPNLTETKIERGRLAPAAAFLLQGVGDSVERGLAEIGPTQLQRERQARLLKTPRAGISRVRPRVLTQRVNARERGNQRLGF